MFSSLLLALAAMVATVLLLGLGFAVGCHFGKLRSAHLLVGTASTASREYPPEFELCLETARVMETRRFTAREAVARFRESAPPELLSAIDQLIVVTANLGEQLQQINQSTSMRRLNNETRSAVAGHNNSGPAVAAAKSDMLSLEEMQELTDLAGEPTNSSSEKRRYPYDCYQQVFPLKGTSSAPNLAIARTVRCHDISVHGISFFWPDEPEFNRLVITLGSNEKTVHMLAEVMQSKTVYMQDEIRMLVGCRFMGRYQMPSVQLPNVALQSVLDRPLSAAAALA